MAKKKKKNEELPKPPATTKEASFLDDKVTVADDGRELDVTNKEPSKNEDGFDARKSLNPIAIYEELDPEEKQRRTWRSKKKYTYESERILKDFVKLNEVIQKYFNACDKKKEPYTVPDLAKAIGLISRKDFFKYASQDNDCGKVARAALMQVEGYRNKQLVSGQGQQAGRIFDMKANHGWREITPYSDEDIREKEEQEKQRQKQENEDFTVPPGALNVQNNLYYGGLPPEPKDMSEWQEWYQKHMKGKEKVIGESAPKENSQAHKKENSKKNSNK